MANEPPYVHIFVSISICRCQTPEIDVDNSCSPEELNNAKVKANIFNELEAFEVCRQVKNVLTKKKGTNVVLGKSITCSIVAKLNII